MTSQAVKTHQLLRLVRNLRTGNVAAYHLRDELERIRTERETREAQVAGEPVPKQPTTDVRDAATRD